MLHVLRIAEEHIDTQACICEAEYDSVVPRILAAYLSGQRDSVLERIVVLRKYLQGMAQYAEPGDEITWDDVLDSVDLLIQEGP
jgi:hypothetical protein